MDKSLPRKEQETDNKRAERAAERYEQEYEQHAERSQAALKGWKTRRRNYEAKVMRKKEQGR